MVVRMYQFNIGPSVHFPVAYCCFTCAKKQLKQGNAWMNEQVALGHYDIVDAEIEECDWHLDYQPEEDLEE